MKKYINSILKKILRKTIDELVQENIKSSFHLCSIAMKDVVIGDYEGDYLEFGANTGKSFIAAYSGYQGILKKYNLKLSKNHPGMRFIAFDAWASGLPEESNSDNFKPPHWIEGSMNTTKDFFIENLSKAGVDLNDVITVEGFYKDTLNNNLIKELAIQKAAVIHFDCDLYISTIQALDFCQNLMDIGTIIIFDDYFRYKGSESHGQYKAFKEFQIKNPQFSFRYWTNLRGNSTGFFLSHIKN
jgi:O-methyltransferase